MNAVQVHIINVSVKTPKVCISPCFTGCVTCAVAATLGAEPIPASLLNNPRLMPCINAIPTPPPNACCQPKAWLTMSLITAGSSVMLIATIISAKAIYPNAIMGTIMLLTLAMRCTPPKIISSVAMVITPPTMAWSKPNACSKAAHSVLLLYGVEGEAESDRNEYGKYSTHPRLFQSFPHIISGTANERVFASHLI